MIKNIYSMYDSAVKAYLQPIFSDSTGGLIRELTDILLQNKDHAFTKHPEDYTLFIMGSYDDQTGLFTTKPPEKIIGMWELNVKETN